MASLFYKIIIVLGTIVSLFHLLCAMGLFSSIIIWLSLEFSAALPSALAFVIGIPCLVCAVISILMFGIQERATLFTVFYIILGVFILIAGISILAPFIQFYTHERSDLIGDFCDDCEYLGKRTLACIENCHDECCFTNYSAPLSRAFIAFTSVALVVSVASIGIGIANLCVHITSKDQKKSH